MEQFQYNFSRQTNLIASSRHTAERASNDDYTLRQNAWNALNSKYQPVIAELESKIQRHKRSYYRRNVKPYDEGSYLRAFSHDVRDIVSGQLWRLKFSQALSDLIEKIHAKRELDVIKKLIGESPAYAYARNYNMLRIMSGLGGLAYSSSPDDKPPKKIIRYFTVSNDYVPTWCRLGRVVSDLISYNSDDESNFDDDSE